MSKHKIIVVTAPSGAGKTTMVQRILEAYPELHFAVSATTRPARTGERHGEDYYFVTEQQFRDLITRNALLEYEEVYPGRFYGTPRAEIEENDRSVLLDLDVKGAQRLRESQNGMVIFIAPPSMDVLRRRLQQRGTESRTALEARLNRASKEMQYMDQFDAVVVNDDLEQAAQNAIELVGAYLQS